MDTLRILIVAADPLARAGLVNLLEDRDDWTIAGQVAPSPDLLSDIDLYRPEVLLWDAGWEVAADTLDALRDLQADLANDDAPPPLIVLLPDDNSVPPLWAAGVRGMLLRDVGVERLIAALNAAVVGLHTLDPALAEAITQSAIQSSLPGDTTAEAILIEDLTPRELDVLRLLAEGLSNRAIAQELDISAHTVKFHVNAIMAKLNARSRTEAVVRATRLGLILL